MHSRLHRRIVGTDSCQAKKNGLTCYRFAASAEAVKEALGYLPVWWEPSTAEGRISCLQTGDGSNRMIAAYAIRNNEYMNISCLFPTREQKGGVLESWFADGDRREMIEIFSDYYEPIRKILRYTPCVFYGLSETDDFQYRHGGESVGAPRYGPPSQLEPRTRNRYRGCGPCDDPIARSRGEHGSRRC